MNSETMGQSLLQPERSNLNSDLDSELRGNLDSFISEVDQTTGDLRSRVGSVASNTQRARRISHELAGRVSTLQRYANGLVDKHRSLNAAIETFSKEFQALPHKLSDEEHQLNATFEKFELTQFEIAQTLRTIRLNRPALQEHLNLLIWDLSQVEQQLLKSHFCSSPPPQSLNTAYVNEAVSIRHNISDIDRAISRAQARLQSLSRQRSSLSQLSTVRLKLENDRGKIELLKKRNQRLMADRASLSHALELKQTLISTFRNGLHELDGLRKLRADLSRERRAIELEKKVLIARRYDEDRQIASLELKLQSLEVDSELANDEDESIILEETLAKIKREIVQQEKLSVELDFRRRQIEAEFVHPNLENERQRLSKINEHRLRKLQELERSNTWLRNETGRSSLCQRIDELIFMIERRQRSVIAKRRSVRCKESDIAVLISESRKRFLLSENGDQRPAVRRDIKRQTLATHISCLKQTIKLLQLGIAWSVPNLARWMKELEAVISSVATRLDIQSVHAMIIL
jgi:chromosome segregation ATPase